MNAVPQVVEPQNKVTFSKYSFTKRQEEVVRAITNIDGQGDNAFQPDIAKQMKPQDSLKAMEGWFHGNTGISVEFSWASGRKDGWCMVDQPNPSPEALENHRLTMEKFKTFLLSNKELSDVS